MLVRILVLAIPGLVVSATRPPLPARPRGHPDELLRRIWDGVQEAQKKYTTGCGTITETRTSALLARPLVFRGRFCAEGAERFWLEYTEPDLIRIRFDHDYLNVTTGPGGRNTEVIEVGSHVRRTQAYFSRENSVENLKRNFDITARENPAGYELRLVPRSERFRRRLNYLVVGLAKDTFLLRSLEVDGKSGVKSVFAIQIASLNTKISPDTFRVYRPK